jgi:5-methylcytosine-specific restriction enzyme A
MRKRFKPRQQKICTVPGCKNLTYSQRCDTHSGAAGMTSQQAASKQFLDSAAWLAARAVKLAETPWCEYCAAEGRGEFIPAVDVDHYLPRYSHPHLKLDPKNLRSSCKRCHGIKTARGQ